MTGHAGSGVRRSGWFVAVLALLCLAPLLLFASRAEAQVDLYWANKSSGTLGRANLDGSGVNTSFITAPADAGTVPAALAVGYTHVYWTNPYTNTIGRAKLDGTDAEQNFIPGGPIGNYRGPWGVAVDGEHVYWSNFNHGSIGRANLDGSGVDQDFIVGVPGPQGLAVDGDHIYWASYQGMIGRANLDGSGKSTDFITGASQPWGVAVDGEHIYWTNYGGRIGRANLDGSGVNQTLIPELQELGNLAQGVAVDDAHIYWTNSSGSIGRANLDGSGVNQNFISGLARTAAADWIGPFGLAVDPPQPTTMNVDCLPSGVSLSSLSVCTATVTNESPRPFDLEGPVGTVNFISTPAGGTFYTGDSCTLMPGGDGSSSCTVYWLSPSSLGDASKRYYEITGTYDGYARLYLGSSDDVSIEVVAAPGAPASPPTPKQQCKNGGWSIVPVLKNQGQCVSLFASGGRHRPVN